MQFDIGEQNLDRHPDFSTVGVAVVSAMVGAGIGGLIPGYDTLYRAARK